MAKSGEFAIYKGTGAAQFKQIPARRDSNGWVEKNGAILLDAAPAVGKRSDGLPNIVWDRKITFAIGVQDICNIIDSNSKKNKLFHKNDRSGSMKSLQFVPGEGNHAGTRMMHLSEKKGDTTLKVTVPFTNGEWQILLRLLVGSCPMMLGWNE